MTLAHGCRGLLTALVVASPFVLSGCLVQSKIQGRYVDDQGECRSEAEDKIDRYDTSSMPKKDRNAKLVTLFSECMNKQGWQVGKPKKVAATTNGPAGPLDPYGRGGYGTASGVATAKQAPATTAAQPYQQQPYQQQPVQPATQAPVPAQNPVPTQSTVLSPGGGQAPLNPPTPDAAAPARYQPARPTTQMPSYGVGAGRQF